MYDYVKNICYLCAVQYYAADLPIMEFLLTVH
jgi:hypothetical protein